MAFPDHIGCGLAGGDWRRYRAMLAEFAAQYPHLEVCVYQLESERAKELAALTIAGSVTATVGQNGNDTVPKVAPSNSTPDPKRTETKPRRSRNKKVNRVQR